MRTGTIIYIGGFELPDKNAAAHRVLSNGKIFDKLDYEVVFIGIDKSIPYKKNIRNTRKKIQGFDCWSLPYPKTSTEWISYLCDTSEAINVIELYENVKYVVCYNYQAFAFLKLKYFCRKKSIKIIADSTEWYSTKGQSLPYKILKGIDTFARMRIIQKRVDGLIVISKYLSNYYKECRNVVCIPPLVDGDEEKWEIQKNVRTKENITLVYAGSPGIKDKINYLIEALVEIDIPFKLFIIGIEKKEYIKVYPGHVDVLLSLGKQVEFLGRLTHMETINKIKGVDFSCFFRDRNLVSLAGFPTKFCESISCGTPVITNISSNIADYLTNGVNGYFVETDQIENIRRDLLKIMLLDDMKIQEMKKNCYSSKLFDYRNYIEIVRDLVK